MEGLGIFNLAERMEHFDTVCQWLWEEWGKDGRTIEDIKYRTRHCLFKDRVPMTFVALLDGKPVCTYSLWTNDLKSRQDLTPWFAVLYVVPEVRRRGIGSELQQHALKTAKGLGYKRLYLITDKEGYYEKHGWKFMEMAPLLKGEKARVYEHAL